MLKICNLVFYFYRNLRVKRLFLVLEEIWFLNYVDIIKIMGIFEVGMFVFYIRSWICDF